MNIKVYLRYCRCRIYISTQVFAHAPLQEFGEILMRAMKYRIQRCGGRQIRECWYLLCFVSASACMSECGNHFDVRAQLHVCGDVHIVVLLEIYATT